MPSVQFLPPDPKGFPASTAADGPVAPAAAQAGGSTVNSSFDNILSCAVDPPPSTAPSSGSISTDRGAAAPPVGNAFPTDAETPATETDSAPVVENPSALPLPPSDGLTNSRCVTSANGAATKVVSKEID